MTELLVRRFIPNAEEIASPAVRQAYGRLSGTVGILLNLCLSAGKLAAGVLTGSISVVADAFNNLSDAGSSVVTLIGFQMAGKGADADHPFGHGRIEYLSGLLVSLLILLVGVELFKSSLDKILHPTPVVFSWLSAVILALSIAVKLWMCLFNRTLSKRIQSAAMAATATDSLSDAVATGVLLLGLLAGRFLDLPLDGWLGVAVSLFIFRSGWGAAKDTVDPLLGKGADPELVRAIEATVLAHPEITGLHDLVIHDYGPGRQMMSFHAEVPADCDVMATHDVIDNIERELRHTYGIETVVHMDPVRTDALTLELKDKITHLVHAIDPALTIHDFRITSGPSHTNLIFDVMAPHAFRLDDESLKSAIREAVTALDGSYYTVVKVDRSYIE